jgi:rare lipoprotein A (peptidoglycan hydrolase)
MTTASKLGAPIQGALIVKCVALILSAVLAASCSAQHAPEQTERGPYKPQVGVASWYGPDLHGGKTASGEIFDQDQLSAAHRTWPIPSLVQVTNLKNGRQIVVRMNDRGPFAKDRLIDLSRAAARALGFEQDGEAKVAVRYIGPAPDTKTAHR